MEQQQVKQLLLNVGKVVGMAILGVQPEKKVLTKQNTQCIKLTVDHEFLIQSIAYWCTVRANKLQLIGIGEKAYEIILKEDTLFLTNMATAMNTLKDKERVHDLWLFFNDDIQSTHFFELQYCSRNTNTTKATFVVRATN